MNKLVETIGSWTPEQAVNMLARAVDEKGPDYVDPLSARSKSSGPSSCQYFNLRTGAPRCIIGHAASYAGVTAADLTKFDNMEGIGVLADGHVDPVTAYVLVRAQDVQDGGGTWGEALNVARRAAANGAAPVEGLP